jgi:hypothetical protein
LTKIHKKFIRFRAEYKSTIREKGLKYVGTGTGIDWKYFKRLPEPDKRAKCLLHMSCFTGLPWAINKMEFADAYLHMLNSFYENRTAILAIDNDREDANEISSTAKRAKMCGLPGENVPPVKRLHFTINKRNSENE